MKWYKCTKTFKAKSGITFYSASRIPQSEHVALSYDDKKNFIEDIEEESQSNIGYSPSYQSTQSTETSSFDFGSYSDNSSSSSSSDSGSSFDGFGGGDMGGGGSSGDW